VMEPRIQYARTSDGISIAFAEAGEGRPLIAVTTPAFSHAELSWNVWATTGARGQPPPRDRAGKHLRAIR